MKPGSRNRNSKAAGGLRQAGSFTWNNEQVTILINSKTGEAAFEIDGKRVEEQRLEELVDAFCAMNHTHPKPVPASKKKSDEQ